jgi:hypothetical protein
MKREKNYMVYSKTTGEAISYHKSADLADAKARKLGAREYGSKRMK